MGAGEPTIREARLADCVAIATLQRRNGLGPPGPVDPAEATAGFRHLFVDNPALHAGLPNPSPGWVLEDERRVVGYLGSIPTLYRYGTTTLMGAAATAFVTDPPFRSLSLFLANKFLRQKNVDLLLDTTATDRVGKLLSALKAAPIPSRELQTVLYWVTHSRGFLRSALLKKGLSAAAATSLGAALAPSLFFDRILRSRRIRSSTSRFDVTVTGCAGIDSRFDDLWERTSHGPKRLLSHRSAAILRWHFDETSCSRRVQIIGCKAAGELRGYLALTQEDSPPIGLVRKRVADLFVEDDDPAALHELLAAAYELARRDGAHVLEVLGFPSVIRQRFHRWRPYVRSLPWCAYYHKIPNRKLREELRDEEWYVTGLDGDTSL